MSKTLHSVLMAATMAGAAFAQAPALVGDINTDGLGFDSKCDGGRVGYNDESDEDSFAQAGPYWYFTAESATTGEELWRTDGTAAGTTLVMDINPGPSASAPSHLISYYGVAVLFTADDGVNGRELWYTDGLTTTMVKDIHAGAGSSNPDDLTVWNGLIWFSADDGLNGVEPWTSDTTAIGTNMFMDVDISGSSSPSNFAPLPSMTQMMFVANDGANGSEPWVTDGTVAGTSMLADIRPGSLSPSIDRVLPIGPYVVFRANDGVNGTELWRTDGSAAGTVMVLDIRSGSSSSSPDLEYATEFNGFLYFEANDGSGNEVWRTDGTAPGTTLVWDANVSSTSASSNPGRWHLHGGELFFRAQVHDGTTNYGSYELCKIDAAGVPSLVADLRPGSSGGLGFSADMLSHNGLLYFTGNDGATGTELFVSDGTAAGTGLLKDIEAGTASSSPDWFTPINATQMIFVAKTVAHGEELWITDGTALGTNLLAEVDATVTTIDGDPEGIVSLNGKDLLFTAKASGTSDEELFKWTPSGGIELVMDIRPGPTGSAIDEANMIAARLLGKDVVVFEANDGVHGAELWISDGTTAGTNMIVDLRPGSSGGNIGQLAYFDGRVYFSGTDGPAPGSATGTELWSTDGTAAGTVLVKDIQVGSGSSAPQEFCAFNGKLYFRANDGGTGVGSGNELWVTDGSNVGTQLVKDIRPGSAASTPYNLVVFNGALVFSANDGVNGTELWMSDGTDAGTTMVADLYAGSFSSSPMQNREYAIMNGWLYMRADYNDGVNDYGREIVMTDLFSTTTLLVDTRPGSGDGNPGNITAADGRLFWAGYDGGSLGGGAGTEMWVSDGTPGNGAMVADINFGTASSSPSDLAPASNGVYFVANDGVTGNELWFTDGTAAGTAQVADLWAGETGSSPKNLTMASGDLFFQADDATVGIELFRLASPGAYARSIGHSGDGSTFDCTAPVMGQPWTYSYAGATPFGGTPPGGGVSLGSVRVWGNPLDNSFGAIGITDAASSLWFDVVLDPIVLDFNPVGSGTGGFVMPNSAAYLGVQINVQSLTLRTTILPFGASNAMAMFLGY